MKQGAAEQFSRRSSEVRLENITKVFPSHEGTGDFTAVNHISLKIPDGQMVTLLGPSGCGKTTTLRMISGFESPTAGNIIIGDRVVNDIPPNQREISMVFQSYALFPHLTIYDNVAYGLKVQKCSKAEVRERTDRVIELMELSGMENRFPNQLSGGQQQRVALARAVVIEPKVLLFDEPLSNLDAKLREHMRDELRAIQKRLGITSLYVTHDQSEAMAISDLVVIMKDGDIIQTGSPREIYEYPNNRFIANFIGKANFLPCVFRGMDGGKAVVTVFGQRCTVPNPGKLAGIRPDAECCLCVRPESVRLSKDSGRFTGVVTRATYYGTKIEYALKLMEHTLIVEEANPQMTTQFAEGDTVFITLEDACVRVLA